MNLSPRDIARQLEYAVLAPTTGRRQLDEACSAARNAGVAVVCVRPCDLRRSAETLDGSRTAVGTVVGFPHGGSTRAVKVHEAREAIEDVHSVLSTNGMPAELDLVVNCGSIISDDWGGIRDEIAAVCDVVHARGAIFKVVYEPGLIDEGQVRRLCETCHDLGPDFLAIGTGFGPREAVIEDVALVRQSLPETIRVKVTCDEVTRESFDRLVEAGADRIATGQAIAFLDGLSV